MTQQDKAGAKFWNNNWLRSSIPKPFSQADQSLNNFVAEELHQYFQDRFKDKKGFSVLEIGCANSVWPIYFQQHFDAKVYGLDYSEIGCEKSRELFKHYRIPGEIYCADLFHPPEELLNKFDLVVSFGVVEHFQDTANCLQSCAAFVKPGGYLFTLIPNIPSIIGFFQKYIDKEIYDIHVPIDESNLRNAHRLAGLDLLECDYFMSINLCIINSEKYSNRFLNKVFRRLLSIISKFFWALERFNIKIPKNRITSPYIIALAKVLKQ